MPFVTHHRDDAPDDVRDLGAWPFVAARLDVGVCLLLGPTDLDACRGSVTAFAAALERAVATTARWPVG